MWKDSFIFGLAFFGILVAGPGQTPEPSGGLTAQLDERIPRLMQTYDIPGVVVALIREGKPVWSQAYGYADLEEGRPMTTDTYCRVESISKSVTAWGVMRLVEQGMLDLDAPVVDYLSAWSFPPSDFPTETITVRQLLSHSSGLPLGTIGVHYPPGAEKPTLEEALTRDAVMMQEPGRSFFYSNTGFNLLELLVESVTGRDFADYMREEVLRPLGMQHADFDWQPSFDPPVPNGHDPAGRPVPVYVYPERASGGLFARVDDIATFITAGMTRYHSHGLNVLSTEGVEQLYTPVVGLSGAYGLVFDAYGLGHFIEYLPGGETSVSHGGQGSGWMTHFQSVPATGDGIIILTNSQRSWPFFGLVLNEWAHYSGLGSAGMGKIARASRVLWAVIALLFLAAFWLIVRRFRGYRPGVFLRATGVVVATVLVSLVIWTANQPYLFLSAVFPVATPWLGAALLVLALALGASALLPQKAK